MCMKWRQQMKAFVSAQEFVMLVAEVFTSLWRRQDGWWTCSTNEPSCWMSAGTLYWTRRIEWSTWASRKTSEPSSLTSRWEDNKLSVTSFQCVFNETWVCVTQEILLWLGICHHATTRQDLLCFWGPTRLFWPTNCRAFRVRDRRCCSPQQCPRKSKTSRAAHLSNQSPSTWVAPALRRSTLFKKWSTSSRRPRSSICSSVSRKLRLRWVLVGRLFQPTHRAHLVDDTFLNWISVTGMSFLFLCRCWSSLSGSKMWTRSTSICCSRASRPSPSTVARVRPRPTSSTFSLRGEFLLCMDHANCNIVSFEPQIKKNEHTRSKNSGKVKRMCWWRQTWRPRVLTFPTYNTLSTTICLRTLRTMVSKYQVASLGCPSKNTGKTSLSLNARFVIWFPFFSAQNRKDG